MADPDNSLNETERRLLVAAWLHGLGPDTDLGVANTDKVVWQVLNWAGQRGHDRVHYILDSTDPVVAAVDDPLVRMTRHQSGRPPQRAGPALFEGEGNWGIPGEADHPPCDPNDNSCRLTELGAERARQLARQHPELTGEQG